MKEITVEKEGLLKILRKNREEHRDIFLEAQKKFRVVAIKALDAQLKAARKGRKFKLVTLSMMSEPEDHTSDYDRVIAMVEMSVDDVIKVSDTEFTNYVQDIWSWSRGWALNNLRYVGANDRRYSSKLAALSGVE